MPKATFEIAINKTVKYKRVKQELHSHCPLSSLKKPAQIAENIKASATPEAVWNWVDHYESMKLQMDFEESKNLPIYIVFTDYYFSQTDMFQANS